MRSPGDPKLVDFPPAHSRIIVALWVTRFLMGPLMLLGLWLLPEGQKGWAGLGFVVIGLTSIARGIVTRHGRLAAVQGEDSPAE
ncbi:MAG: hypothetical protein AB7O26_19590 [Planctomycetaceae bacterium]